MSSRPKVYIRGNYDRLIAWKNTVQFVESLFSHYTVQVIRLLCIEYRYMKNIVRTFWIVIKKFTFPKIYFFGVRITRLKLSCICFFSEFQIHF